MSDLADRLIVALDTPSLEQAEALVVRLRPAVRWFKVGAELFTAAGPEAVRMVHRHGALVFLDLKWHDIPRTVAAAVRAAASLGVAMMNVHLAAGAEALRGAVGELAVAGSGRRPLLLGVTVLTSLSADAAAVVAAAREARACGLDGVVASAREVPAIRAACGEGFLVVAPGIRPSGAMQDDQRRAVTAGEAIRLGADFLVVGRPVVLAADPAAEVARLLAAMRDAAERTNEAGGAAHVVRLTP
ncbi:MAG TPA: orotidine-5'-phosphate decarboxylase [bacterium]|nr:orotidine-5'-phosphate decarboxylase [bacterium]